MASNRNEEMRLLQALSASEGLKVLGCRFARGLTGGITVTIDGFSLGAWYVDGLRFRFSRVAHLRPERTALSVKDVLGQTTDMAIARRASEAMPR